MLVYVSNVYILYSIRKNKIKQTFAYLLRRALANDVTFLLFHAMACSVSNSSRPERKYCTTQDYFSNKEKMYNISISSLCIVDKAEM